MRGIFFSNWHECRGNQLVPIVIPISFRIFARPVHVANDAFYGDISDSISEKQLDDGAAGDPPR